MRVQEITRFHWCVIFRKSSLALTKRDFTCCENLGLIHQL